MGKYGEAAIRAVDILHSSNCSAEDAWREAATSVFSDAPQARDKICPREAFLGLCQHGLIAGVQRNRCVPSETNKNRTYATATVRILAEDSELAEGSRMNLWRCVMKHVGADPKKKHNQQLDVVLSLRARGLIAESECIGVDGDRRPSSLRGKGQAQ